MLFEKAKTVINSKDMSNLIFSKNDFTEVSNNVEIDVDANLEAIVFVDNVLEYVLKTGKHTVELKKKAKTQKLDIYFVNKGARLNCLWGTSSRIDYIDYKSQIPVSLGASGSITIEIDNSLKLFQRVVANRNEYSQQELNKYIKTEVATNAKNYLAGILIDGKGDIFTLNNNLESLSNAIGKKLEDELCGYGLKIIKFSIENLAFSDEVKRLLQAVAMQNYVNKNVAENEKEKNAIEINEKSDIVNDNIRAENEKTTNNVTEKANKDICVEKKIFVNEE